MAQLFGLARIGKDAEVRYTSDGGAVASLSLAFTYGQKDSDGKRPTQWVKGSLWGKKAEALAPYLLKGTAISVTLDDIHLEEFTNRDGQNISALAGRVSSIEFAGGNQQSAQKSEPPKQAPPPPKPAQTPSSNFVDMDDDIPF